MGKAALPDILQRILYLLKFSDFYKFLTNHDSIIGTYMRAQNPGNLP